MVRISALCIDLVHETHDLSDYTTCDVHSMLIVYVYAYPSQRPECRDEQGINTFGSDRFKYRCEKMWEIVTVSRTTHYSNHMDSFTEEGKEYKPTSW